MITWRLPASLRHMSSTFKFGDASRYCKSFVGGAYREGSDSVSSFDVFSPRDYKSIGRVFEFSKLELDEIISDSKKAFKSWRTFSAQRKSHIFSEAASLIRNNQKEIALLEVVDTGKTINEATADVQAAAESLDYFASQCYCLEGSYIPSGTSYTYTLKEPLGVCYGIGAWNFPICNIVWKAAPALCVGNSMIYKPSPLAPVTSALFAEIMHHCGLPKDVLNVVQGGVDSGSFLCNHQDIPKVSFTGGAKTGQKVAEACSRSLKRVTLELGGKASILIFEDCDVKSAVNGMLMANFFTQGQVCSNASKVFVQQGIYEDVKGMLLEAVKSIRVGDPFSPDSNFGPLISKQHFELVQGMVDRAISQGAKCLYGGDGRVNFEGDLSGGYYMKPTVFENIHDEMEIFKEEIFGPVLTLLPFDTEEDAIEGANNTNTGLASGLYTTDLNRAKRVAEKLDASTIYVNTYNVNPAGMAFGGRKMSGYGRENSKDSLESYYDLKSILVETAPTNWPL